MRILDAEITNFRSIEHLNLRFDNDVTLFVGANDSGKSNIVEAMDLAIRHGVIMLCGMSSGRPAGLDEVLPNACTQTPGERNIVRRGSTSASCAVRLAFFDLPLLSDKRPLELTLHVIWRTGSPPAFGLEGPPGAAQAYWKGHARQGGDEVEFNEALLVEVIRRLSIGFRHVDTRRQPVDEPAGDILGDTTPLRWRGRLKELLVRYKNSDRPEIQARFERLREICLGTPVGELSVGFERGGKLFAKTRQDGQEPFDIEDRGTGIQQLVHLLALAVCHEGRVLAVEEPELNLSSTLQRVLKTQLRAVIDTGQLQQLFITSHSHVFEEEAERVVVSRVANGPTTAEVHRRLPPVEPDVMPLAVGTGGEVTLPDQARKDLKTDEGQTVFLRRDASGYHLLSMEQMGDFMRDEPEGKEETRPS